MSYFKPIKTMICSTLIASLAMSATATMSHQAHADTDYYYRDGLNYPSDQQAYQKAKKLVSVRLAFNITRKRIKII